MPNIILKNREGEDVVYENVLAVQLYTDDGGTQRFTTGGGDFVISYWNDDGTETLYSRPIMYGDSAGDVISLGLMEKPTKENTELEKHTFLGWAATIGGTVETAMFENVTQDLTVYAVFKTVTLVDKGTCGDNAVWRLYDDGNLRIFGTGDIADASLDTQPWKNYRENITEVAIEDGITTIGNNAFSGCTGLTNVTIPSSVTTIGNNAFSGCTSLTNVYITDLLVWLQIDFKTASSSNPMYYADYLYINGVRPRGELVIPEGVTRIPSYVFSNCDGITSVTIPNSVTNISGYAFSGCTGLTNVTIPNSVTTIGNNAFSGCKNLEAINVATENLSYCSADGVLYNKSMDTICRYPYGKGGTFTIPSSVTSIGNDAFFGSSSLTNVTIPNSVTTIGGNAFSGCTGLTSVTIPSSVTKVDANAFKSCTGLTSIHISDGVTAIGNGMFQLCTGLTSVTIPSSVTSIGLSAFDGCANITTAVFKTTTGWTCSFIFSGTYTISSSDLANASTAATYLKTKYAGYEWKRT